MCTAITYKTQDTYFGRNLDLELSYGEEVVITPRNFPLNFRHLAPLTTHFAIIGMATVAPSDGQPYPLYYDAINEHGLGIAGLNFPGNAVYHPVTDGRDNLAQFELVPWLLGQCRTVADVKVHLENLNLADTPFSDQFPPAELHWLIADADSAIVVESVADGLKIYDNPIGVLTNNPPFPIQSFRLHDYLNLSAAEPTNQFAPALDLQPYCHGLGAHGLPGDLSSGSRFVKAAFTRLNSVSAPDELSSVSQFFHILHSVDQPRGSSRFGTTDDPKYEITIYSSCCNLRTGVYYYTCYDNHQITAVDLHRVDLDGADLSRYPLITTEQIAQQN